MVKKKKVTNLVKKKKKKSHRNCIFEWKVSIQGFISFSLCGRNKLNRLTDINIDIALLAHIQPAV